MSINYIRVGLRIQEARKLRNMSATDLAGKINFTPKSVVYMENGRAEISLELLVSLCTALNISPNDLLKGEYICHTIPPKQEQDMLLAEMRELMYAIRGEIGPDFKFPKDNGDEDDGYESAGTVVKTTDEVIHDFRTAVKDYKEQQKDTDLRRRSPAAERYSRTPLKTNKKNVHW